MSKKILLLTENFPPLAGGSGRWFWELYSRLDRENILIVADDTAEASAFDNEHDLNIIRMPLMSSEWGLKSLTGIKFYLKCIFKLKKIVRQHGITEIHCGRVIHEGVSAWLLSLISNIKFTCYVHGEDVETAATSREHNLMVKQVCKKSEHIICNSLNTASIVKRLSYFNNEQQIKVLNPGVDSHKFTPLPKDPDFLQQMGWDNKKVIITVGRLQKRKGQDMMIQAMPAILAAHPDTIYAVIGHGECYNELDQLIEQYQLSDNVQLLDNINDQQMIQCYQQCDLFILPNRTIDNDIEGFGMVLVEAQSCGKAVIAGDSGGTRETMLVDESGLIVDCTSTKNISDAIIPILAEPEKLRSMGEKGRQHVEKELDWKAHVEKAKNIFQI